MDKTAIRNFAIWARNKLISDVAYRAGLIGITADGIADKLPQSTNSVQFYDIGTSEPYQITGKEITQRSNLAFLIKRKAKSSDYVTAYNSIIEEVAYTWFNRLIAVRFMEVNDYLPSHIRVLSSESGKIEPDIVTNPFDADLDLTEMESSTVFEFKQNNDADELFKFLFVRQCNKLSEILPRLFEKTDDYTELLFNCSYVDQEGIVYRLTHDIPEEDFDINRGGQVEIIGWLYQYYNAELKDNTFALLKKNVKITKERIPSATQLFTPDWIVRYMVENSLGRLWTEGHVNTSSQLRGSWKYYLEEAEQEPEVQVQLNDIRKEYAELHPEDIKLIDPCMGSGHILVYAFDVLMQIYASEGYNQRDAASQILEHNIFGLDIDDRAAQLAYFAVMMKARQYNRRILDGTHDCHVLAIQESNSFSTLQTYEAQFGELASAALCLTNAFTDAKEYGSILNIPLSLKEIDALNNRVDEIRSNPSNDLEELMVENLILEVFPSLLLQARIMLQKYDVVVTNPPYMGSTGMSELLLKYVKKHYPYSSADLCTVFMQKALDMNKDYGLSSMINTPAWMTLSSFEDLRLELINRRLFVNMLHFGRGVFGADFGTTAFVLNKHHISHYYATYMRLFERFGLVDSIEKKEQWFLERIGVYHAYSEQFLIVPGNPIAYWVGNNTLELFKTKDTVGNYGKALQGTITGDNERFLRVWFEVLANRCSYDGNKDAKWFPHNKGGSYRKWYGNREYIINWQNDGFEIKNFKDSKGKLRSRPQNTDAFFQNGITWSDLTAGKYSARYLPVGSTFDAAGPTIPFKDNDNLRYILGYFNSPVFQHLLDITCPGIHYNNGIITKLPIVINDNRKTEVDEIVGSCVEISKADWDSFETSWDFKKHPLV